MLKKIIIAGVIILVLAVAAFFLIPWGEYESTLEKSEVAQEVSTDSSGSVVPSLSLIQGDFFIESGKNEQAELLFDVEGLKATKGAFEKFSVNFNIDADYKSSALTVNIESNSINTGNKLRDEHLAEEDFFDVHAYPEIKFESTQIEDTDTGYVAKGSLTLLDAVNPIDVPFKHLGNGTNKNNKAFEAFEGQFVFDRIAFGMEEISGAGNIVTVNFYCELLKK